MVGWNIFIFSAGVFLLIYGADVLIKVSVKLSRLFNLAPLFIGIILVAFGTSLPELAVGVVAAIKNQKSIALGNIVGSNIANIGLILGGCSIFYPLTVTREVFRREIPLMLFSTVLLYLLSIDGVLGRIDGVIFLALFVYFCVTSYRKASYDESFPSETENFKEGKLLAGINSRLITTIIGVVSLIGVVVGAHLMVKAGVRLAEVFHVSPWIIGITVFAIGTSLPELAASFTAAVKKIPSISVGNIIGSNVFNVCLVLGVVSLIRPVTIYNHFSFLTFDMPVLLLFSAVLVIFMRTSFKVSRKEGVLLFSGYGLFILLLILRG